MGNRYLTDDDRNEIWELYGKGKIPLAISEETGRAFSTVSTLIKQRGGIRPPKPEVPTGRLLSFDEREEIALGLRSGDTFTAIASRLGRDPSTVSREVNRNGGRDAYRATTAAAATTERATRPKQPKLAVGTRLGDVVRSKLEQEWSPEQITAWLMLEFPDDEAMRVSPETIYVAIYTGTAGMEAKHAACLRTGRKHRRPPRRKRHGKNKHGRNPHMVSIRERPVGADDRTEPGHWEGDLIFGSGHRRAIGTLVERMSRYTILIDLVDGFTSDGLADDLFDIFDQLDPALRRSVTWDQGSRSELASHQDFTKRAGVPVYFCDPRSPWQRPTNENTNGLLRQYFPKGETFSGVTGYDLDLAAHRLNTRPRQTLEWLTPQQRLTQLCATTP